MKRVLLGVLFGAFLFGGCSSRGATSLPQQIEAAVFGGGRVALDPLGLQLFLGTLLVVNQFAAGTADAELDVHVDCPAGVDCEATDFRLQPGEQRLLNVFTTKALVATISLTVITNFVGRAVSRQFPITWNNAAADSRALALWTLLGSSPLVNLWFPTLVLAEVGLLTRNSNPNVPRAIPQAAQEVRLFGAVYAFFLLTELQALFGGPTDGALFPSGPGAEGLTVSASPSLPQLEGDYVTFWMSMDGEVPIADAARFYQYAFVVDSDGLPGNNFQPAPSFPDDFFGGTDRWYTLDYSPTNGWNLRCRVVGAGNQITTVASAAKAIISQDTIVLMAPRGEFVLAHPPFRATTFGHAGDYGQNPPYDWSGDPTPAVADGLHSW